MGPFQEVSECTLRPLDHLTHRHRVEEAERVVRVTDRQHEGQGTGLRGQSARGVSATARAALMDFRTADGLRSRRLIPRRHPSRRLCHAKRRTAWPPDRTQRANRPRLRAVTCALFLATITVLLPVGDVGGGGGDAAGPAKGRSGARRTDAAGTRSRPRVHVRFKQGRLAQ